MGSLSDLGAIGFDYLMRSLLVSLSVLIDGRDMLALKELSQLCPEYLRLFCIDCWHCRVNGSSVAVFYDITNTLIYFVKYF